MNAPRLLLVDDELQILNMLHAMISKMGYEALAVDDGTRALDLIDTESFDLIITDLKMPLVSGLDIAAKVKQKAPGTPVIMLTGWTQEITGSNMSALGIDLLLQKPFRLPDLANAIAGLLLESSEEQ